MKVFVNTPPGLSRAMSRVEQALMIHAPKEIEFVHSAKLADVVFLHVIGHPETADAAQKLKDAGKQYVIIQYCLRTTQKPNTRDWLDIWQGAKLVWSYYDLHQLFKQDCGEQDEPSDDLSDYDVDFYHSPLGVDASFRRSFVDEDRYIDIMTSGYVSHPCAEAIEEAAYAAHSLGKSMTHLGPVPEGFGRTLPGNWVSVHDITDDALAGLYQRTKWVSGLRHGEGFELPALEGLACGARPILFDRPEMRQWYGDYAVFVPECHSEELEQHLVNVLKTDPLPVTAYERKQIHDYFDWSKIMHGLWQGVL